MSEIAPAFYLVTRTLELSPEGEEQVLVELLLVPEAATFGNRPRRARSELLDLAEEILSEHPLDEINRRLVRSEPALAKVEITVEPARRSEAWREGIAVTLEAIVWDQGAHAVATVPALNIAVIAPDREHLPEMLADHVLLAIKREGLNRDLLQLAQLERGTWELTRMAWTPGLGTARDRWKKRNQEPGKEDALAQLCTRMEGIFQPRVFEVQTQVAQLARLLNLDNKPSILLVGPSGVGKTALVQKLAADRGDNGLGQREFHRTSGARLIAGACGFGQWQLRCRELFLRARELGAVLHLGSLFELLNVGQSSAGNESIASFIRPYLVRREVQVIAECTPEQLSVVERIDPRLGDAFRIMKVEEPAPERADAMLLAASLAMANDRGRFTRPALHRVAGLHRRFMGHAAFPGAPLRFMRRLHEKAEVGLLVEEAEVYEAFTKATGMPRRLLDPTLPLDLNAAKLWFEERVQGQPDAVAAVVAMIARLKAGLSRPGRPLMSLLFTGPTGTGKTEMAKALAEFLFQAADRMIRLDMSEYNHPWSAQRLVSGSQDGREGLLTAAVRDQPFNVLLLDEFEKADPAVFDLLLQVLGEARLTDAAGRTADFSNCVVIMTSNLGAREFSRGRLGFQQDGETWRNAVEHFTAAVQAVLRPEMFNRIDSIVPYRALSEAVVESLTRRELAAITQRPGLAGRKLRLEVAEPLIQHLAREGYDPRYGARPLKRRIAQELLAPLSAELPANLAAKSLVKAELGADGKVKFQFTKPLQQAEHLSGIQILQDRIEYVVRIREALAQLRICTMMNALGGNLRVLEARHRRLLLKNRRRGGEAWVAHDPRFEALKECVATVEAAHQTQTAHEEALILALHHARPTDAPARDPIKQHDVEEMALTALEIFQPPPQTLVLEFRGQPGASMLDFVRLYRTLALSAGGKVQVGYFAKEVPVRQMDGSRLRAFASVDEKDVLCESLSRADGDKLSAIVLWVTGGRAPIYLKGEGGLHLSRKSRPPGDQDNARSNSANQGLPPDWTCRISVHAPEPPVKQLKDFHLALDGLSGQPDLESGVTRRQYDPVKQIVKDGPSGQRESGKFDPDWLLGAVRQQLLREALS
ncbi:MAG TPA: AAA family ATPase [Verrucomicrobium sp.]|nr:AAA family ATPase [Verrucomicrobium sp.]